MRFVAKVVQNALLRFRLHERSDARVMREPMPMLLGRARNLFDSPAWTYEPKWDGFIPTAHLRGVAPRRTQRHSARRTSAPNHPVSATAAGAFLNPHACR